MFEANRIFILTEVYIARSLYIDCTIIGVWMVETVFLL